MNQNLTNFRQQIDSLDRQLIHLLSERFKVTKKVGQFKRRQHLPATDLEREKRQFAKITKLAVRSDLDPKFAQKILRLIIDEVVKNHKAMK